VKKVDDLIIGAGIFGVYAALYLARQGRRVLLLETGKQAMARASVVNQARLHAGYHYPRSIGTARLSDEYRMRFMEEHASCMNGKFKHYYALDQFQSFTDADQFQRFAQNLNLKCEEVSLPEFMKGERIKTIFLTEEISFDPVALKDLYLSKLAEEPLVELLLENSINTVIAENSFWKLGLKNGETVLADRVVNASYAGTNGIHQLFKLPKMDLNYELSEVSLFPSKNLNGLGLTVMDGPFCSTMPYGNSGLHSLTSVLYTHHAIAKGDFPEFDCQSGNQNCLPQQPDDCNICSVKPSSSFEKMKQQLSLYVKDEFLPVSGTSKFAIKVKLKSSQIDDGRPTQIGLLHENPPFYCIFAGKINAIYEIEKVLNQ
jgi:hypothetical protein